MSDKRNDSSVSLWLRIQRFFRRDLWAADLSTLSPMARLQIRVLRLLVVVAWEFSEGLLTLRAMGLVYTTLLSIVPFLAVTFSVLKAFGAHYRVEPFLAQALEPLGPEGVEITRLVIEFVDKLRVGVLGALGVAGLFYTVISLLGKIEEALNQIWQVRRARSLARKFTDYLSIVLVGPVLVFTAFALTASAQSHWLVQRAYGIQPLGFILVFVAGRVMPVVFLCAAFTFLYRFIPNTRVQTSSALIGGATAGILWQLAGAGFAAFVASSGQYNAIYSSFAILVLFLIWLYVSWLVVLVGAQVAYFHQYPSAYLARATRRGRSHLFRERLALSALVEVARRHLSGGPPFRPGELSTALNVPPSSLEDLIEEFVRRGILFRTSEPEGVVLGRPPEHVTVTEILDALHGSDTVDEEPPGKGTDPVSNILRSRNQAAHRALKDITLRSLTSELPPPALDSESPVDSSL